MSITYNFLATAILVSMIEAIPFSSSMNAHDLSRMKRDEPSINYRLPDNIIPISYKIRINPDLDGKIFTFHGESEIRINVKKSTNEIVLHAKNLEIAPSVGLKCNLGNNVSIANVNTIDNITDFLKIILETKLSKGSDCDLTLKYTGKNSENLRGLYRTRHDKKWIASTHMEPIAARQVFPCWDEPALKANFTISIEHSKKYVALSNMHIARQEINPENSERLITHFAESPKMSTYLVAFAIGDFVMMADPMVNFRIWTPKELSSNLNHALETGAKLMEALENYTNFSYQDHGFTKLDSVLVKLPRENAAMENWGLITFQEHNLFPEKNSNSISKIEQSTKTIAHELAHQWFGNLVTLKWWDYTWLNEGFAKYFEYAITDQIWPSWRLMERFVTETVQSRAFIIDSDRDSHPMEQIRRSPSDLKDGFDSIGYAKSGSIVRTISYVLGEEKFKIALRNYLKTKAFGSATSDDLFEELAKVSIDIPNLPNILKNWVTSPGYPVITVKRDYDAGKAIITQSRFLDDISAKMNEKYWIPINFVTEDNLDFTDTNITHWFDPSINSIEINHLKKDQFVIFNKQQFGYYRVNYDNENWQLIIKYLKNKDHTRIHVLNRAQLLDDAFNLAQVGQLDYKILLTLLEYLKKETDFVVWTVGWKIIAKIYESVISTELSEDFKKFALELSKNLEKEVLSIELDKVDSIMKLKRVEALTWTCKLGSSSCESVALKKLHGWFDNPEINALSADEKDWIACAALHTDDRKIWEKLRTTNTTVWITIDCLSNISKLEKYMSTSITENPTFSQFSLMCILLQLNIEHGVTAILNYINNHYKEIINLEEYSIDQLQEHISMVAEKIRNKKQRDKLKTFIESNKVSLNGKFDEILANVDENLRILDNELHKFKEFFKKNMSIKPDTSIDIVSENHLKLTNKI